MTVMQLRATSIFAINSAILGLLLLYNNCSGGFEIDTERTQLALEAFSAPSVTVTSSPATLSNQRSGKVTFHTEAGTYLGLKTVNCQIGSEPVTDCRGGSFEFSNLSDGDHTLKILAENNRGLLSEEAVVSFRIDATMPTVEILSAPAIITGGTGAEFSIRATDALSAISRIECAKDDGTTLEPQFSNCTGMLGNGLVDHRISNLSAGVHRLRIQAIDAAGNRSDVIQHRWQVDLAAPSIEILEPRPQAVTNQTSATFQFRATDDGQPLENITSNFECQLSSVNSAGNWSPCVSPVSYTAPTVNQGTHTFRARARDRAGNLSQPISFTWIVDSVSPNAPTITANVGSPTRATSASFSFTAIDQTSGTFQGSGVVRYECRFNSESAFRSCTSPTAFPSEIMNEGSRAFHVRSVDAAGNNSSVRSFEFVVDRTPPSVTLNLTQTLPYDTDVRFDFAANDNIAIASLRCSLNASAFVNCSSPHLLSNLARTNHVFEVQATDTAGNSSISRREFVVAVAPTPTPTPTPVPTATPTPPPGGSTVTARLSVTRLRGPAPLAVLFNASASRDSDPVTVDPFKDLSYSFDAGDGSTATYAVTGLLKRRHSGGPLFAYVYETPRATPYVARVRVQNARGVWTDAMVEITVEDPNVTFAGANTVCVGASMPVAGQGGCPSGAATRTTLPASTEYSGKRVLLRRGDTFGTVSTFTNTNDAQIGAFGTGAPPNVSGLYLGGNPSGTPGDHPSRVSVMDLNVTGSMANNVSGDDLLYLRMRMSNTSSYFEAGGSAGGYWRSNLPAGWNPSHIPVPRRIFIVEGVFDGNASYGQFFDGAIIGSTFHANPPNQHAFRAWGAVRSYFGHNHFGRVGDSIRHSFKMHSFGTTVCTGLNVETITSEACATSQVVMANNIFGSATNPNSWTLAVRPQNNESAEGIEDYIVENNVFVPSANTNADVLMVGRRMTERGNVRSNGTGLLSNSGGTSNGSCSGYILPGTWCGPYYLRQPSLPANYP